MNYELNEHPRESVNWRHHRHGCPYYRERWFNHTDPEIGEPMYQVFCLMDTPPETVDEQEKCLSSRTRCWRLAEAQRRGSAVVDIPIEHVGRRRPA